MKKLENKVAVITGASKGIGAGIAKHLAAAGASVVVNYASAKGGADAVVAEIVSKGGKAIAVQANVSNEADVTRLFDETKKAFGAVDILVNNAGVYKFGAIEAITPEDFHNQFDINVLGLLLTTQGAVKNFNPNGGSIINIGSVVSSIAPVGSSIYTATKGAVDAITHVLAKELGGKKIRVNSINPGMVETEGTHTAGFIGSDFEAETTRTTPLGRIGQPDDIADVAVFLASDDSRWLTGDILLASGGVR
ncbi:SDR family NAD(P)-dependent oxidoreductase [Mucilaginibacter paludis]|uniref:Short-chain dehydrogenase/reductase SDR n=1 Tax=Mucilaginibacter paludis DSM 18603 TaxID=714943 RepID=H1YGT2_9SPHI|nr:glucose 1-dehydrogenase [Mucilaginibacter paludis]EHQ26361.1 short-chain dehydrogenase/reductase SDR [Mucilaginibacter paludis DSM 18603]